MTKEETLRFAAHVVRTDYPGFIHYWPDLISAAAVAILEGRDAHHGIKDFLRKQRRHELQEYFDQLDRGWRTDFNRVEFWIDAGRLLKNYLGANHRGVDYEEYVNILKLRAAGYEYHEIGELIGQNKSTVYQKVKRAIRILAEQ